MLKPNIALTMFPLLIPKIALNGPAFKSEENAEASPFYVKRVAMDAVSKKLMVQISQVESGVETVLEIPPSDNQAIVQRALELALATNTPVLVCLDQEGKGDKASA